MIDIISKDDMFIRNIFERFQKAISRSPAVILVGARQTGKTTFVNYIAKEYGYNYITLDNLTAYLAAQRDPISFIKNLEKPVVIDEVQRVPELFLPIKQDIDFNRAPGRYILTGSANPLLIPKVADALTGRIETLHLYP